MNRLLVLASAVLACAMPAEDNTRPPPPPPPPPPPSLGGQDTILIAGHALYVAEQTAVKRLDPGATSPLTLVSGLPSGGHGTRTLVIGPDNFMYVAAGSSCNVCVELAGDSMRAAVTRFNLEGSGGRIFAR